MSSAAEIIQKLEGRFPSEISGKSEFRGETSVTVRPEALRIISEFLRDECGCDYLLDILSIDHFNEEPRFEVVYEHSSLESGAQLRIKTVLSEDDPQVDSIADIWPAADWMEREVYDMMGIRFRNHPNLKRILMWEGYPYHPLRKDFPLEGKHSDVAEVAFTDPAPLAGGPFVTLPTDGTTQIREPRARHAGDPPPQEKFIAEP